MHSEIYSMYQVTVCIYNLESVHIDYAGYATLFSHLAHVLCIYVCNLQYIGLFVWYVI